MVWRCVSEAQLFFDFFLVRKIEPTNRPRWYPSPKTETKGNWARYKIKFDRKEMVTVVLGSNWEKEILSSEVNNFSERCGLESLVSKYCGISIFRWNTYKIGCIDFTFGYHCWFSKNLADSQPILYFFSGFLIINISFKKFNQNFTFPFTSVQKKIF